ncbi:MAG: hypothetical protein ACRDQD_07815 [Nocardioidaceae bacterium]
MKLDEILAESPSMPTGSTYVCLDGEAVGQMQRLERERTVILAELAEAPGKSRKASESAPKPDPRIVEIDKQLDALDDRRRERSGVLNYTATDGGTWTLWCSEHPAREDNNLDGIVTKGYCNAEELIADLGKYVTSWDAGDGPEPITAAKWTKLSARLHPKSLWDIASGVTALHTRAWMALPKSQSGSAPTASSETA